MSKDVVIPNELIISKIYLIRGQKVMLDRDLAELYESETRILKQAVRRNRDRFPADFMFELTRKELSEWRSQFVMSKADRKGLRYAPMAFTEHGVLMLSSVLKSKRAVEMNIQIIRIFVRMREMVVTHKDILLKLERLERNVAGHDKKIQLIFQVLKQLLDPEKKERRPIGFKSSRDKA